jgi:hypothetical protein
MGLNRALMKLEYEITKVRARLAELESASRVLRELEGGKLATQKVRQLGKMMQAKTPRELPEERDRYGKVVYEKKKRKITKPIMSANGKPYVRVPRDIWQGQVLNFLKDHPASTVVDIATGMQTSLHTTQSRIKKLFISHHVNRTGTGRSRGEQMYRFSVP